MESRAPQTSKLREVAFRLKAYWFIKTPGISAFITAFFMVYLHLLKNPTGVVTIMPVTWVDDWIGVQPLALWPYASLWIYVVIGPVLQKRMGGLWRYLLEATAVVLVGLEIFHHWPTAVPVFAGDWSHHEGFGFLKTVDAAGNACPSLHAAFAVFTAIWIDRALREIGFGISSRVVNACWCVAILYSTLATKQHVAIDLVAGTVLGAVGALAYPLMRKTRKV